MVEVVRQGKGAHEITCRSCDSVLRYHNGETKRYDGKDYSGGSDGKIWIDCPVCAEQVTIKAW